MSLDILPPANDNPAPFQVTDAKITRTAVGLGCFVFFCIYPAYELLRHLWGAPESFSVPSTITALVCAVLFGWNVRRRVRGLARIEPPSNGTGNNS